MRRETYLAIFEPSADGYGVYFPDFPGCISFGATFEEAQREATDALSLHIYGMEKDGETLPTPTLVPVIDPDTAPGYFVSPIVIYPDMTKNELDGRRVKTNVTLPAWLKDAAEQKGINYSRLLEMAILDCLNSPQKTNMESQKKRKKAL
ncbi:MAG: type II toxin-antitoxin system HicB family antitoxin [Eubacteriales bacterium]|nr:type II toxin-antitoxin system HicB family antitoxin [Eubacteriales bacterium]